jgi:hypothetical protein
MMDQTIGNKTSFYSRSTEKHLGSYSDFTPGNPTSLAYAEKQ